MHKVQSPASVVRFARRPAQCRSIRPIADPHHDLAAERRREIVIGAFGRPDGRSAPSVKPAHAAVHAAPPQPGSTTIVVTYHCIQLDTQGKAE
jgi:hypothetical protein